MDCNINKKSTSMLKADKFFIDKVEPVKPENRNNISNNAQCMS